MASLILDQWREQVDGMMSRSAAEQLAAAFRLAEEVKRFDFSGVPPATKTKRYR
jgi:hypothetical protein